MNSRVLAVSLFLLVSGFAALVFQTAWLREFRLIFGASTPASAAVLAIFMGGLGLGNAVLGRRADASQNPLKFYAILELGISAAAAASPFLIDFIRSVYFSLGGQETLGASGATIVRLLLSTLVLGVPTFLMGGTLAAAARAVTAADDAGRRGIGWLYGLNTIGAVIGTLVSTFILLERLGNRETLWAASAVNLANAALAWQLARRWQPAVVPEKSSGAKKHRTSEPTPVAKVTAHSAGPPPAPPRLVYVAAALVGFAFLLMELVWYRMLGPILGGTTFTFGVILAVALAGIGVGGALYPWLFRGRTPTLGDLALSCAAEALAIAIPFALGDRLALLAAVLRDLAYFGFSGQAAGWIVVAAIVILPAALVSGVQFPLLIALLGRGSDHVGRQVGLATAWNTAGAMAGSLAGGFGLLPLLSAIGSWQLVVMTLAGMALTLLLAGYRTDKQLRPLLAPLGAILLAALCLTLTGPTSVWRHSGIGAGRAIMPDTNHNDLRAWENAARHSIIWQADGQESSVAISAGSGASFIVNGKSDGNALTDASTQIMFPMIGAILHPDPKLSLVIGLGTGESAGWLAELSSMERVDVVELEPEIAVVAELCAPINNDVLRHPKARLIYNDGREVLQTSRERYDLIASEPSNPYRAGVANLYTQEFYHSVRDHLAPGGIFVQWLQGYEVDAPTVRSVFLTAQTTFGHVEIWQTKSADLVLICSPEPLDYDLARLQAKVADPTIREALRVGWRTDNVEGVLSHFIANEKFVAQIADQKLAWINTDNRNLLEFTFARTVGRQHGFSIDELRLEARSVNLHRPLRLDQGVDWDRVEDEWIASWALESPLHPDHFSGDRAARALALRDTFLNAPPATAVAIWNTQPRPPRGIVEVSWAALAYARAGDDKARPLIEQVRRQSAIDADALAGTLAYEQGKLPAAAGFFFKATTAARTDPTSQTLFLDGLIERAVEIAGRDKSLAPRIDEALSQPFAVLHLEQRRQFARWLVAKNLDDAAQVAALADWEPHVLWNFEFLRSRALLYERVNHPRRRIAAREVLEFHYWMPQSLVLARPDFDKQ